MVSLARSSLAFLSFCRSSTSAFLLAHSKVATRGTFLATTGLVTASLSFPPASLTATATCDSSTQRTMTSLSSSSDLMTGYLNAADAAALDAELMSTPGFCLEQLMELAGLAVAEAVYQVIPPSSSSSSEPKKKKILLICGPGNNGGDGLVAARHLVFFGYDCVIVYPKRSTKQPHFLNLVKQCDDVGIPFLDEMPDATDLLSFDAMVDAIFGFSFHGEPREPFATALKQMQQAQQNSGVPVISVDVPSGWNVNEGDVGGAGFMPQVLVSLTAPKESSKGFPGRHFIGGRFLPPPLAAKYHIKMPPYPGVSQVMEVTHLSSSSTGKGESTSMGWEAEYAAYLSEKDAAAEATDASSSPPKNEPSDESWEAQYAAHCAEKEARLADEDARRIEERKNQQQ